jgi:hypothetical protein
MESIKSSIGFFTPHVFRPLTIRGDFTGVEGFYDDNKEYRDLRQRASPCHPRKDFDKAIKSFSMLVVNQQNPANYSTFKAFSFFLRCCRPLWENILPLSIADNKGMGQKYKNPAVIYGRAGK